MIEHSLPLWPGEGWDSAAGGLVEKLDIGGKADLATPRRVRVQARRIYCFAKAAHLGGYPQGREIAMKGLEYLLAKGKSPDGRPGFVRPLNPDSSTTNPTRDTYDHALVLLALSTAYELTNDSQIGNEIKSLLEFIDVGLRSPHGGFIEAIPATLPRRQNPQMHLFEAMIATLDATRDPVYQNRAGDLYGLFVANLYDRQRKVLGEYFEEDWSRIEPVIVEPGHQAEWVWLLKGFERVTGCPTARHRAELLASALHYRHDATGCLFDQGTSTEASESLRDGAGRRQKSQRHGSRRPRLESRVQQTKHETPLFGCIGTICTILSWAAGTINSIAATDRWSIRFQPPHLSHFLRDRGGGADSRLAYACFDRASEPASTRQTNGYHDASSTF
jgi:hypothetical protein